MKTTAMITSKLHILAVTAITLAILMTIAGMARAEAPATEPKIAQPAPQYLVPSGGIVRLVSENENGPARMLITRPNGTWIMLLMKPDSFSLVAGRGGTSTGKARRRTSSFRDSHGAKERSPELIEHLNEE